MIGLPQRRSTSLALAFMATSIAPFVIPARNVAADRVSSDRAKPSAARAAAKAKPAMTDAGPLRKRWREKTHERHRHDRAGGKSQKRDAEPCVGKREVRLDPGDRRRPCANSKAIRQEDAERREALRPGRGDSSVGGKLEGRVDHLGLSGHAQTRARSRANPLQRAARGERQIPRSASSGRNASMSAKVRPPSGNPTFDLGPISRGELSSPQTCRNDAGDVIRSIRSEP